METWNRTCTMTSDIENIWELWTWLAEETGLALGCPDLQIGELKANNPLPFAAKKTIRGRGTKKMLKTINMAPTKTTDTGAPRTCVIRESLAIHGSLRSLMKIPH